MFALRTMVALCALLSLMSLSLRFVPGMGIGQENQSQAFSALDDSEAAVVSAYQAVSKADAAGANVSGLLVRLNEAGELLTRAHLAYESGDFGSALELADLCQERLSGFVADADALTEVAVRDHDFDFMLNMVGSVVGAVVVICGGFVAWHFLEGKREKTGSEVR